ncbi:unnamed protein product [Clavelina lepadiformis]|uniref:Vacuolar ATPase assembly protein VMA22 n=1 Tax=Clavelina lepadiformis TaxID=159417 RepID=A0ABP0GVX0_CLALP
MVDKKLEAKLDLLCVELLELVHEIDKTKREQEDHMKEGYLCLAKARYEIGVDRVSQLQYPSEMVASVTVHRRTNQEVDQLEIIHGSRLEQKQENPKEEATLRKRNKTNDRKEQEIDPVTEGKSIEDVSQLTPAINPIHWFGFLVPRALRLAQESFSKAIEASCALCNLQSRYEHTLTEYRKSRTRQKELDDQLTQGGAPEPETS